MRSSRVWPKHFQASGATAVKQLGWKERVDGGRTSQSGTARTDPSALAPNFPRPVVSTQDFPQKRSRLPPCARLANLFLPYLNISPSKSSTTVNYVMWGGGGVGGGHCSSHNVSSTGRASEACWGSEPPPRPPTAAATAPVRPDKQQGGNRGRQRGWGGVGGVAMACSQTGYDNIPRSAGIPRLHRHRKSERGEECEEGVCVCVC